MLDKVVNLLEVTRLPRRSATIARSKFKELSEEDTDDDEVIDLYHPPLQRTPHRGPLSFSTGQAHSSQDMLDVDYEQVLRSSPPDMRGDAAWALATEAAAVELARQKVVARLQHLTSAHVPASGPPSSVRGARQSCGRRGSNRNATREATPPKRKKTPIGPDHQACLPELGGRAGADLAERYMEAEIESGLRSERDAWMCKLHKMVVHLTADLETTRAAAHQLAERLRLAEDRIEYLLPRAADPRAGKRRAP